MVPVPLERRPRALIIDDEPAARALLASALVARGIDAIEAADGLAGLRVLVDQLLSLDLLVTDVMMPVLSGESLVRTIRQLGGERDLAILVVSGALDEHRAARLRASGADAVLAKADGAEAVADAAERLLAARGLLASPAAALPVARIALEKARS